MRFTEVGGLSMEMATEEVPEGGENRFVQKYPLRAKYPELVLKRGLLVGSDGVRLDPQLRRRTSRSCRRNVYVMLLNELARAAGDLAPGARLPDQVDAGDLNANSNTVAIETLQLYYQYFTVDPECRDAEA